MGFRSDDEFIVGRGVSALGYLRGSTMSGKQSLECSRVIWP